jgi:hypothetical protein
MANSITVPVTSIYHPLITEPVIAISIKNTCVITHSKYVTNKIWECKYERKQIMYIPPQNRWPYPPVEEPPPPNPKYRFRYSIYVGIPVVIGAILFLLNGIDPSFEFEDIMYRLGVINDNRYVRFTCLLVICISLLLIVKLFRNKSE